MKFDKITIITEPVVTPIFTWRSRLKKLIKYLLGTYKPANTDRKKAYGGHYAVTRSLIEGLQKSGVSYNYNPAFEGGFEENVVVLSGANELKKVIELKKKGKIKRLYVGPNIVERSCDADFVIADQSIDLCIVPSKWVEAAYIEDCVKLNGKIRIWHAGIDPEFWKPSHQKKRSRRALVYWKTEPESFCMETISLLKELGYQTTTIIYGKYQATQFKNALDRCDFAVFISRSESQGIALLESWAMDVPTFIWDPHFLFYNNKTYTDISAAPYLCSQTGVEWLQASELKEIINKFEDHRYEFAPRKKVLEAFTDEICAKNLLQLFT